MGDYRSQINASGLGLDSDFAVLVSAFRVRVMVQREDRKGSN